MIRKLFASTCVLGCAAAFLPACTQESSSHANVPAPTQQRDALSADETALVQRIRSQPSMSSQVSMSRGQAMYPGVEIHYVPDQFGENPACQIEFIAHRPGNDVAPARKWFLIYFVKGSTDTELLNSSDFHGSGKPLRMFFDDSVKFLPMTIAETGDAVAPVTGEWLERLVTSDRMKILHGVNGAGEEIAFTYDVSNFESIRKVARHLCWSK